MLPVDDNFLETCRRFEVAVGNFGRSCARLKANESAFQAWYAAAVIQEFGLARVYREVHLLKDGLFDGLPIDAIGNELRSGNELFPDLALSRVPNVDARHSAARLDSLRDPGAMLAQFAVVTELKVTGSTKNHTPPADIRQDLTKLMVFTRAWLRRRGGLDSGQIPMEFQCYMVVLDNARRSDGTDGFSHPYENRLGEQLREVHDAWSGSGVAEPKTILITPTEKDTKVIMFENLIAAGQAV